MERAHNHSTASLTKTSLIARAVACSWLLAATAQVAVPLPWTPVPMTLQTLGVLLVGLFLPPAAAAASLALYLFYGAVGMPVFAPTGPGGVAAFVGSDAGYLLGFPVAAFAVSWLFRCSPSANHWVRAIPACSAGMALVYLPGALWLSFFLGKGFIDVLPFAVFPFVLGDLLKIVAASSISRLFLPRNG